MCGGKVNPEEEITLTFMASEEKEEAVQEGKEEGAKEGGRDEELLVLVL